jgi:nitric oxide reductase NorQ protein
LGGYHLDEAVSTRLLVYAAKLVASGMAARTACRVALVEPLSDEPDTLAALMAVVDTQFGA